MQNIDKIAFGVVGLIVVGLCAFALFVGGGEDHSSSISAHAETIDQKKDEQNVRKLAAKLPEREQAVKAGFELGDARPFSTWSFYRRPAELDVTKKELILDAVHAEPDLLMIEVTRDSGAQRAFQVIRGRAGESERVKGLKIFVEIKAADGDWADLEEIAGAAPGADFEVTAESEPGKRYQYRIRSEAMSATKSPLTADQQTLYSIESDPILLPPNYNLKASASQIGIPGPNGWQPGRSNIRVKYYDYESGTVKQKQRIFIEPDLNQDPSETKDVFPEILGEGWKLSSVSKKGNARIVELRNKGKPIGENKLRITDGEEPDPLEVSSWENETAGSDEVGDDPEASEEATAPDDPVEPESSGGGSNNPFGDDDD